MAYYPRLFSPIRIGSKLAKNRIVSTPHAPGMAVDGFPAEQWLRYEREKARGGAGIIMMFGSASVHPSSPVARRGMVEYWNPAVIPHLRRIADALHEDDALAIAQLAHWGRAGVGTYEDSPLLAPSDEPDETHHRLPRAMTVEQIHEIVEAHAQAAKHIQEAGFDGVDLSYWGGHLGEQFLSPLANHRTDEYGGSFENRLRFGLEVLAAVRDATGPDFVIGTRLSGDQFEDQGLGIEEIRAIAARLAGTGQLDYVTVSGGSSERYRNLPPLTPTYYSPPALYNDYAAAVRKAVSIPVIVAGRITHPAEAEEALRNGVADAVAMTRALIADPHMPRKVMEGHTDDVRFCTGASEGCIGRVTMGDVMTCIQNPVIGREAELVEVVPAPSPRRIVVVGGGVAGLEAARMAAIRGHSVTLFEAEARTGGQLNALIRAPERINYAQIGRWLEVQSRKAGAELRLGQRAAAAAILAERPDSVVIATGATPRSLPVPRASGTLVASVEDVLLGRVEPRGRCVVVDYHGHMPGPNVAEFLLDAGHSVEIVSRLFMVGIDIEDRLRISVYRRLLEKGAVLTPLTFVRAIDPGFVQVEHTLTGERRTIAADTVVEALGGRPDNVVYDELRAAAPELDVHLVGDALAARNIHDAILTGTRAARAI